MIGTGTGIQAWHAYQRGEQFNYYRNAKRNSSMTGSATGAAALTDDGNAGAGIQAEQPRQWEEEFKQRLPTTRTPVGTGIQG
jgi:hypothetical protein